MCKDEIKVTLQIPYSEEPDKNGHIFPREVVEKAIQQAQENMQAGLIPFTMLTENTQIRRRMGVVKEMTLKESCLEVEAVVPIGGLVEMVKLDGQEVTEMSIRAVSLTGSMLEEQVLPPPFNGKSF